LAAEVVVVEKEKKVVEEKILDEEIDCRSCTYKNHFL
jgi:hypothetical protein